MEGPVPAFIKAKKKAKKAPYRRLKWAYIRDQWEESGVFEDEGGGYIFRWGPTRQLHTPEGHILYFQGQTVVLREGRLSRYTNHCSVQGFVRSEVVKRGGGRMVRVQPLNTRQRKQYLLNLRAKLRGPIEFE